MSVELRGQSTGDSLDKIVARFTIHRQLRRHLLSFSKQKITIFFYVSALLGRVSQTKLILSLVPLGIIYGEKINEMARSDLKMV